MSKVKGRKSCHRYLPDSVDILRVDLSCVPLSLPKSTEGPFGRTGEVRPGRRLTYGDSLGSTVVYLNFLKSRLWTDLWIGRLNTLFYQKLSDLNPHLTMCRCLLDWYMSLLPVCRFLSIHYSLSPP